MTMPSTAAAAPAATDTLCRWEGCARPPAPRRKTARRRATASGQTATAGAQPTEPWRAKKRITDPGAGRTPVAEAIETAGSPWTGPSSSRPRCGSV